MKQKLKPETWVGIFLIAGILMIIGVILGFGNIKTSKEQTYPINIISKMRRGSSRIPRSAWAASRWGKSPKPLSSCLPAMKSCWKPAFRAT